MNLRAELALNRSAHGQPMPGLFFRPDDAVRLEGCLSSLLWEGRSLALSSANEALLDHYAQWLVSRLRLRASCPVETYFPSSTQTMLSRFDEQMARLTLQESLSDIHQASPQRIWLVHDAGALADHELQLLARLVGQFPGAGIRVVLLGAGLRGQQAMAVPGRRFLRWDIDIPNPEEAQAMRLRARAEGCEHQVAELLRHVQPLQPLPARRPEPQRWFRAFGRFSRFGRFGPVSLARTSRAAWWCGGLLGSAALLTAAAFWLGLAPGLTWPPLESLRSPAHAAPAALPTEPRVRGEQRT